MPMSRVGNMHERSKSNELSEKDNFDNDETSMSKSKADSGFFSGKSLPN